MVGATSMAQVKCLWRGFFVCYIKMNLYCRWTRCSFLLWSYLEPPFLICCIFQLSAKAVFKTSPVLSIPCPGLCSLCSCNIFLARRSLQGVQGSSEAGTWSFVFITRPLEAFVNYFTRILIYSSKMKFLQHREEIQASTAQGASTEVVTLTNTEIHQPMQNPSINRFPLQITFAKREILKGSISPACGIIGCNQRRRFYALGTQLDRNAGTHSYTR